MIRIIFISLVFAYCHVLLAQTNNTFFLGHSLVNFHMPNMVNKLSMAAGEPFSYKANVGNGAGLKMHWENPHSPGSQGSWWDTTLNKGGFQHFIFTEAVPLKGHITWNNTRGFADSFYSYANVHNTGVRCYLYETWHCINSGTPTGCDWDPDDAIAWRTRLQVDLPLWESIADTVNAKHSVPMYVIPAGQALARLFDSIQAGKVPGISNINQLYSDDIHLTHSGNYFIACLIYSVIHKKSPLGLPNQLTDEWGVLYSNYPTTGQAAIFQKIAWETVCAYSRDGVNCGATSVVEQKYEEIVSYPNPNGGVMRIKTTEPIQVKIYNAVGACVYSNLVYTGGEIRLAASGLYSVVCVKENKLLGVEKVWIYQL